MRNKNLKIFCVTDKVLNYHKKLPYIYAGVGNAIFPSKYLLSNSLININHKEKYYSELTFHYLFWKNKLKDFFLKDWIGFCQKRRFWIKKESKFLEINKNNLKKHILLYRPKSWDNFDAVICEPNFVNNVKKIKLLKRGLKSLINNPLVFFDKNKQSVKLHFDMHHGYGNLDKAINVLRQEDREEFRTYVNNNVSFNPHIMFVAKTGIAEKWFSSVFPWLFKCEKIFGFKTLEGYDSQRLYAYLAERYLSFWFKKYSKYIEWPYITF